MNAAVYPGTPQHQALLEAVVSHYAGDPRVLAVVVFGSLGRGNWDAYSDLDLDVVIEDGVSVDVVQELDRLGASFTPIGERVVLLVPDGEDAGDLVLASLLGLSVRYHSLDTTSPNIVESLQVLAGRIAAETIKQAGLANRRAHTRPLTVDLDRYVRLAVDADVSLQRRQFWRAFQMLHLMREGLLQLFAFSRGGVRPVDVFQMEADSKLQRLFGTTLPQYSLHSAQQSLVALLDITEQEIEVISNGTLHLTDAHKEVIAAVRERQAQLHLAD